MAPRRGRRGTTTARYFTPNGRSIQAQGIVPDIQVNRAKLSDEKQTNTFKEADLAGHLSNGNTDADENQTVKSSDSPETSELNRQKQMLAKDFQLQEALSLLKAIDILNIKQSKQVQKTIGTDENQSSDQSLTTETD